MESIIQKPMKYDRLYNWYFLGSSGDISTDTDIKVSKKKKNNKKIHEGLHGTAYDLAVIDKIIAQKPNGKDKFGSWVHIFKDQIICTDNGILTRNMILNHIKTSAENAQVGNSGEKHICLYYTGHGAENLGDWIIKDGKITLQDIINQFNNPKDKYNLRIYSDCCYSGKWVELLEKGRVTMRTNMSLMVYSSCAEDELATEQVFADLLKDQIPDYKNADFKKLRTNVNKIVYEYGDGETQTIKMWESHARVEKLLEDNRKL